MAERLSAFDGSFLRVETANAHMHVAWSATFRVGRGRRRPSLARLRRHIEARLELVPRFRTRLAYPPPGMGEPFWVDDSDFDVSRHVLELGMPNTELDDRRFAFLCDRVLSEPLFWIATNAGYDGQAAVDQVRAAPEGAGLNALTGEFGDLYENGVIDPVRVTRLTIENAASVAALLLTTEAVVAEELIAQPGAIVAPGFGDLAEGLARPSSPV